MHERRLVSSLNFEVEDKSTFARSTESSGAGELSSYTRYSLPLRARSAPASADQLACRVHPTT